MRIAPAERYEVVIDCSQFPLGSRVHLNNCLQQTSGRGPENVDIVETLNTRSIWRLMNLSGGWTHPIHIHDEELRVLTRNGVAPPAHERGLKDVFVVYDTPDYTQHMGLLTFGNEPEGKWAGTYALDTPENIAFHVLRRVDPFKFTPWPETPSPSAASRGGEQSRRRAPGRSKQVNVTSVAAASTQLGTIADNGGGSWTYTPAAGFTGTDTFLSAASCEQPPVAGTDSLTAGCYLTTRRSCRPMSPSARIWWTSWIARERVSTPPAHPYPDGDVRCCGILQRPEGHNL